MEWPTSLHQSRKQDANWDQKEEGTKNSGNFYRRLPSTGIIFSKSLKLTEVVHFPLTYIALGSSSPPYL